jgi:hypothetical protein
VNSIEDRLRDAYRSATDTVSPDSLPGLGTPVVRPAPHRGRRFRFTLPAVAAAATAAAVAAALTLAPHATAPRTTTVPAHPATASGPLPTYIVAVQPTGLFIYDTTSGTVTGTIDAPSGQQFEQVISQGNDQSFVVTTALTSISSCAATSYRLQLSASGTPGQLTRIGTLNGYTPTAYAMAGTTTALSVARCSPGPGGTESGNAVLGYIAAGGRHWTFTLSEDYPSTLAVSADTGLLAFPMVIPGSGLNQEGLVLSTASRPGAVARTARVAVRVQGTLQSLSISPDGATLYGCSVYRSMATLAAYDTATGARTGVLDRWRVSTRQLVYCDVTLDSSGRYLLASVDTVNPATDSGGARASTVVTAYRLGSLTPIRIPYPLAGTPTWNSIAW